VVTTHTDAADGDHRELNGTANPNGAATTGWFRYGTASPGTCNDSFGTRAPAAGGSALGAGRATSSSCKASQGSCAGTTYYVCAIASNSVGTSVGTVLSFTTPLGRRRASRRPRRALTNSSAYAERRGEPQRLGDDGLLPLQRHEPRRLRRHLRLARPGRGRNFEPGQPATRGWRSRSRSRGCRRARPTTSARSPRASRGRASERSCRSRRRPRRRRTTAAATLVTSTTATLNGSANPNGDCHVRPLPLQHDEPGHLQRRFRRSACRASAGSDTYLGSARRTSTTLRVSGLVPATTYYYCAIAYNSYGTTFGAVLSFTTLANAPTVTTSTRRSSRARRRSSTGPRTRAAPRRRAGSATRRQARAPATTRSARARRLAGGPRSARASATRLSRKGSRGSPATTYYFCAIAQNVVGTSRRLRPQFTTPAPPAVTTTAASSLGNTLGSSTGRAIRTAQADDRLLPLRPHDPGVCDDVFGSRAPAEPAGRRWAPARRPSDLTRSSVTGLSLGDDVLLLRDRRRASRGRRSARCCRSPRSRRPRTTTSAATLVDVDHRRPSTGRVTPNGDGGVPATTATARPTPAPATTPSARARRSRGFTTLGLGSRHVVTRRSPSGLTGPHAGDDVLLLRDRLQLVRDGVRRGPALHDAGSRCRR
jgi:hypothetical protein